jgi:D-alanyl-D-alanine endopeptidase (penicillin-binding protein 7)
MRSSLSPSRLLAAGQVADNLVRVRVGVLLTGVCLLLAGGSTLAAAASAAPPGVDRGSCVRHGRKRGGRKRKVFLERRVPAMKGNQPNVQSLGALVVDLDTGQELFARKPDQPRPIASISKLAAALVVMDRNMPLEELTTIKRVDVEVGRGGAPSRLREGMTLTNRDLLHAALMGSDNRAVSALGRAAGLTATQLAASMTKKAQELGLRQTRFLEPTGLSPENVSTPREIIAMLRAAMDHPVLGPIVHRIEYDAHPVARPAIRYVTTHRPAAHPNTQVLGGKTGYNDSARYCLVLVARVSGRLVAMSFLGTEGKLTRFGDVARVADWIVAHKTAHPANAAVTKAPSAAAPPLSPPLPVGAPAASATPAALEAPAGGSDTTATAKPAPAPPAAAAAASSAKL